MSYELYKVLHLFAVLPLRRKPEWATRCGC